MKSKHARTIHAFRASGRNAPGYSQPKQLAQQLPAAPAAATRRSVPHTGLQRPADARTPAEALDGLMRAAAAPQVRLVMPRFISTAGPWVRLGEHETRVPADVMVATSRARGGRDIAVVGHLDSSTEPGRIQVLVSSAEGVRELIGLTRNQLAQIRETYLGR